MLKITVFGHWQGSSLCECLVSSWIIPTELCRCSVRCRRARYGCGSRNFFTHCHGEYCQHRYKGIASCVGCMSLCKAQYTVYCSMRKFYPEPWQCVPGLLPEVWSFLFPLCFYLTIIIAVFVIYVILVWVPVSSSPALFQFILQAHIRQQTTKELFLNGEHFEQKKKTVIIPMRIWASHQN